jgi:nitrite transporter NirC
MINNELNSVITTAKAKVELLNRNPIGYFAASIMPGMYIAFGNFLIYSLGGRLTGLPYTEILMGASFALALSLVIMAGGELFTGNNFILAAGLFGKKVMMGEMVKLFAVCYIGNWAGSVLFAVMFRAAGLAEGAAAELIASVSKMKVAIPFFPLFIRGVLCNILVCLAVWCSFRCRSEAAKLIMAFWCVYAFTVSGFEHSIANMSLLTISLFAPPHLAISISGYFYNILTSTLGNMAGGIFFVALPYYLIAKKQLS